MASRCYIYLGLPIFEIGQNDNEIEKSVLQGAYAFAEYAVCFWALHLEAAVVAVSESGKQRSDRLGELAEYLETFLDLHWANTDKTYLISKTLSEHLTSLRQYEFFDKACQAVAAAKSWLRPTAKAPIGDDVLRIPLVVKHIRTVLKHLNEAATITVETKSSIEELYGRCCYKCDMMSYQFFHRGFMTGGQLEQHTSKHERSFIYIEQGCFYKIIGFTSANDLEKHTLDFHGIQLDSAKLEFPEDPPPPPSPTQQTQPRAQTRSRRQKTVNSCPMCNKTYTRAYNLKSHILTHANERPFVCETCGKSFARQHDCWRHEDLHSGEKRYVCGGELSSKAGTHWGCGKRFARVEGLRIHLRSEAGRMCIQPLRDQEAVERQQGQVQNDKPNRVSILDLLNDGDDSSEVPTLPHPVPHESPETALGQFLDIGDTDFSQGSEQPDPPSFAQPGYIDDDFPDE